MSVAGNERIVRPIDFLDPTAQENVALVELEFPSDAGVAETIFYCQHVRPMDRASMTEARKAEHNSNHRAACIEGARSNSSDLLDNLRKRCGDDLGEVLTPDFSLEILEGTKILGGFQRANTRANVSGVESAETGA